MRVFSPAPVGRYVLIAPVRDEARYLQEMIDAIVAQTIRPMRLVIVNDGSSDSTGEISELAAARHAWISVLHLENRGRRSVGPGVIEAFYEGYQMLKQVDYDYLCKIDGDITLGNQYFDRLLRLFKDNRRLGLASGKVYLSMGKKLVAERMQDDHVAGQVRFYNRKCFQQIGGLVREVMWDVIDEHRARMNGWETRSFSDLDLQIIHHRLMGSSHHSIIHGRLRRGRGQYFMGTHPLYLMASGIYRMWERPFIVGGLFFILGYLFAFLGRHPQYEDRIFRQYLRSWQMKRLSLKRLF